MRPDVPADQNSNPPPPAKGSPVGKILASGAVAVALIVALAYLWKTGCQAPADSARTLAHIPAEEANALADVAFKVVRKCKDELNFTPRVVRDTEVLVQESTPSLELATATRRLSVEMNYTNTWLGSEKSLSVRGTFVAKGGFNLRQHCELRVMPKEKKLVAIFPNPEVLSVELVSHEIIKSEDGLWNRLRPEDQKTVLDALYSAARRRAASTVLREARKELEKVVGEAAGRSGTTVEFRYGPVTGAGPG